MNSQLNRKLKSFLRNMFARFGYDISKTPKPLLSSPGASLTVNLDFVIQHHQAKFSSSEFFFLQIGAYDGVTNDPIRPYMERYNWRGILIEPQREPFLALKENYKDHPQLILLNNAVADSDGIKDFYQIRNDRSDLPEWSQQIASFSLPTLLKHKNGVPDYGILDKIPEIEELITTEKIECLTFKTLLNNYNIDKIDLLQIDAEGYDYELIKQIPFNRIKPWIIHYEHMHLSREKQEECIQLLIDYGYRIGFEFADTIAYLG